MRSALNSRVVIAACTVAALAAPSAAQAKHGHGRGHDRPPAAPLAAHGPKAVRGANVIVAGTVAAIDGNVVTVTVAHANHHGRGLVTQQLLLDVSSARVVVADANGDGSRTVADVAVGDRVVAQLRIPRGSTPDLTQPFAARRLVDVGPAGSDTDGGTGTTTP